MHMDKKGENYMQWLEHLPEAVIVSRKNGSVLYANGAACRMSGYDRDDFSRLQVAEIVPEVLELRGRSAGTQAVRRTLRKKNGETVFVDVMTSELAGDEGAWIISLREVDQQAVMLEKQFQHDMKMTAIGTLAGGIAHDFNNILAAIIGYGQILREQLPKESSLYKEVEQILNGGMRATDLVKQILTFSRQNEEKFQTIRIQHIIKEVATFLRASLPSTIHFTYDIDMECPPVLADASQIHQVLINLCTNARDAIDNEPGKIHISLATRRLTEGGPVSDSPLVEPGEYLVLGVKDDGCGMGEGVLARIFEPFFTTKAMNKGTGLGLATVHGIVKKHGGDLTVHSSPGKGSLFSVYLPAAREEEADGAGSLEEGTSGGNELIMVVDDESAVRVVLKHMLSREGYRVHTYEGSLEAVRRFRENPGRYDLIITDMTMPDMTGAELARECMSLRPELPVILMTGYSESVDREKALTMGIKEFILKPFPQKELCMMVREVLDHG